MKTQERINKLEKELEVKGKDMCTQYYCARSQRVTELWVDLGLTGTSGYQIIGCYECNGHRIKCGAYTNLR